ncbi:serine/threonine-protein kinase [Spongiactinospora sp. TRM90649]|uniref:serine/threonine-protein kinase n=1 Tax=Spongiactinospora sp. TRM90649 TaxID=3031114 RepID=UPI0023F82A91|nr:serine/threonine-protein kinase [Spongiactinospora sp. TRM90649]MDF5759173.1 serine/threonine-protein kinase [Spongiactinospora sp. TRM90649]
MSYAPAPKMPLSPTRQVFSVIWALVPLFTLGFATVAVIGSAAIRTSRRGQWLATAVYLALFVIAVILIPGPDEPANTASETIAMTIWFAGLLFGGTVHAFIIRADVFRPRRPQMYAPMPYPPPPGHPMTGYPPPPPGYPMPGYPAMGPTGPPGPTGPTAPPVSYPTHPPAYGTPSTAPSRIPSNAPRHGTIGDYSLDHKIGEGGQGQVYVGTARDGRRVAVKVLHDRFRTGSKERDDFMREVTAAQRVPQFSTARIIDIGLVGDTAFIVSEYVSGPSLQQLIREKGPLDGDGLTRIAIATSAALNAIHSAGVIHRDFKPANVLIGSDGPRVIDFGIAKALDQVTMTVGGPKGTPPYMSPEQINGEQVGPETDIFSWAATMYFGATGELAFAGTTAMQIFHSVLSRTPDLHVFPPHLRTPLTACFDKNPRSRPTAAQLMVAITS